MTARAQVDDIGVGASRGGEERVQLSCERTRLLYQSSTEESVHRGGKRDGALQVVPSDAGDRGRNSERGHLDRALDRIVLGIVPGTTVRGVSARSRGFRALCTFRDRACFRLYREIIEVSSPVHPAREEARDCESSLGFSACTLRR